MAETGRSSATDLDLDRRLSAEDPHGLGETAEQHAQHAHIPQKRLFGLSLRNERILFYCCAIPSWALEIAAAVTGAFKHTWNPSFIATMTAFLVLHWSAWLMTAFGMIQRASWVRDEGDLLTRRQYLYLAVRLNRLQLPTAVIALTVFIQAYVRRNHFDDLPYWLLFLLTFIWCTVFSVMNAYNNITWELDRLMYEEGEIPYGSARLAILGIPTNPKELPKES